MLHLDAWERQYSLSGAIFAWLFLGKISGLLLVALGTVVPQLSRGEKS